MYIALTSQNKLIDASSALGVEDVFSCPLCKRQVILKNGNIIIPYFSHLPNSACAYFSENESQDHLATKIEIHQQISQKYPSRMEVVLPEIKQRADVLFENGNHKVAVEIQFSPISVTRLQERTRGYKSLGINVIWLLGNTYSIKQLQLATINKFIDDQQSLYFWQNNSVTVISDIVKSDFQKLQYKTKKVRLLDLWDPHHKRHLDKLMLPDNNPTSDQLRRSVSKQLLNGRVDTKLVTRTYAEFHRPVSQLICTRNLSRHISMKLSGWEMQIELLMYLSLHPRFEYVEFFDYFNSNNFFYARGVDESNIYKRVIDYFLNFLVGEKWLVVSNQKYFVTEKIKHLKDGK